MNFRNVGSSAGDRGKEAGRQPAANPATPLARQLSVYSLTFDEFQSTLGGPGKDFGSMNMDEFLRNIWTAEESHVVGPTADSAALAGAAGGPAGLQRQGSLTLPRTLSQKTVDEVWRDLLRESGGGGGGGGQGSGAAAPELQQRRQATLGEMTLEEFLVRAGVVREDMDQQPPPRPPAVHGAAANNGNMNCGNSIFFGELPGSNNGNSALALGFPQAAGRNVGGMVHGQIPNNSAASLAMSAAAVTRTYPAPLQVGGNVDIVGQQGLRGGGMVGDPGMNMNNGFMSSVVGLGGGGGVTVAAMGSPDGLGRGNGDLSSLSPVPYHVFGTGMRGRKGGAVEKVVERRQRRMIKNRESAARSRARKQAYTMELEAEVAKLKEQNEELQKKQAEIMEMQKNQVMEMINQQRGPKKLCLRRLQTGPW